MQKTLKLLREIESVREQSTAHFVALAIDGGVGSETQDIISGIRALALVSTEKPVHPDSPLFQSNPRGIRPTRHILSQALALDTDGYFSLIEQPTPVHEGDSSLYSMPRLKELVSCEPSGASVTRLRSQPETIVYLGNLQTLINTQNDWARQIVEQCTTAAHRGDQALAERLAWSSLGMLPQNDSARYGVICRLGKLGKDADRLFDVFKIDEKMGVTRVEFLADIAKLE